MAHTIEGNATVGFRVVDDERGPLTGRKRTEQDALEAAGLADAKPSAPRARRAKKSDDSES